MDFSGWFEAYLGGTWYPSTRGTIRPVSVAY
jgi:hypothetical protein